MSGVKPGEFPLVCVVQPAVFMAYISTSAIPDSFRDLSGFFAGFLVGAAMVLTALFRFYCLHSKESRTSDLSAPLIPQPSLSGYTITSPERWLFTGTVAFLATINIFNKQMTDSVLLALALFCSQARSRKAIPIISGSFLALITYFTGASITYSCEIAAVTTGIIFQSLASQCLPLWDFAGQRKLGFNISSLALVALYISASTLQLVT